MSVQTENRTLEIAPIKSFTFRLCPMVVLQCDRPSRYVYLQALVIRLTIFHVDSLLLTKNVMLKITRSLGKPIIADSAIILVQKRNETARTIEQP